MNKFKFILKWALNLLTLGLSGYQEYKKNEKKINGVYVSVHHAVESFGQIYKLVSTGQITDVKDISEYVNPKKIKEGLFKIQDHYGVAKEVGDDLAKLIDKNIIRKIHQ